jgi:2-polyprenyl-3-methyl-5-hydroxy-6-metoxy-1,4-benzoquinol methylase
MSIWNGKWDYHSQNMFDERTDRALHDPSLFARDGGPLDPDNERVVYIKKIFDWFKGKSYLEVGCGFGRWSDILKDYYTNYTGVDPTKARIDYATKTYETSRAKFQHIGQDWNLYENFDVIFSFAVIQHLTMPDTIWLLKCIVEHMHDDTKVILYEGRLGWFTEEEAEELYASEKCSNHMIYKPIGILEMEVPELKWRKISPLTYVLERS